MSFLCDTKVTKDDLETIFQKYFNTKAKIEKADGTVISKGLGYLSDVIRVDLTWNVVEAGLPTRIVAKVPKMDYLNEIVENIGAPEFGADFVTRGHNAECKVYKILQHGSPIPVPKIYDCWPVTDNHPGVIVMEDLSGKAGIPHNIAEGVNVRQWQNIVASLADLHSWSLTTNKPWREQLPTLEDMKSMFNDFDQETTVGLGTIKEKYPEYFNNVKVDEVKKALDVDKMLKNQEKFRTIYEDVMFHGDTWVNNIMFEKKSDGSFSDNIAAFVDWQMSGKGCGINDLTRFETWCVNHEMRRNHYKEMLRFYYDRMKAKAGDKIKATYEQFEYIYKESFIFNGLLVAAGIDGMIQSVVRADEDKTGWRKKEMLERARALYEDAAVFAGWA